MNEHGSNTNQSVCALLKELTEFCQSDSLSEDGLREIIERHGCALKNNDLLLIMTSSAGHATMKE